MDLCFIDDKPRMIYQTFKYARTRSNIEEITLSDGTVYWMADANSKFEALEHIKIRSELAKSGRLTDEFKNALVDGTNKMISVDEGQGFMFLMTPFEDWCDLIDLEQYIVRNEDGSIRCKL